MLSLPVSNVIAKERSETKPKPELTPEPSVDVVPEPGVEVATAEQKETIQKWAGFHTVSA